MFSYVFFVRERNFCGFKNENIGRRCDCPPKDFAFCPPGLRILLRRFGIFFYNCFWNYRLVYGSNNKKSVQTQEEFVFGIFFLAF